MKCVKDVLCEVLFVSTAVGDFSRVERDTQVGTILTLKVYSVLPRYIGALRSVYGNSTPRMTIARTEQNSL